ncbi:RhoGAP domain [Phytophthora infestans]|uniref:RhoGAP domain n=1 Tax=Phytophthora infestans TaxID=4787 RepID=A0A833VXJ9_PHYIN|nr:RhoGAP domain [Phytophthora infestans]
MATSFSSRFRRGGGAASTKGGRDERVGEMLSDSSDDGSPLGGDVRRNAANKPTPSRSNDSSLRSSSASEGDVVTPRSKETKAGSMKREYIDTEKDAVAGESKKRHDEPPKKLENPEKKTIGSLARSQSSRTATSMKKPAGRKWYSDSDEEEEEKTAKNKPVKEDIVKTSGREDLDLDAYIAGSVVDPPGRKKNKSVPISRKQERSQSKQLSDRREGEVGTAGNESENTENDVEPPAARHAAKKMNMLKLMTKTRTMSPFGSKRKGYEAEAPEPTTASPAAGKAKRGTASSSEHSTAEPPPATNTVAGRPTAVQTGGAEIAPTIIVNRRTDRLKHSANGSEYSGSPRLAASISDEVLSPGLRKVPGAFAGRPGSGVLLEGWLRQKQRRGIKGLKKWNSRYFVLYARSNEVRYYADVVQSAWGPIPLGEIGSISLRLIQRIGKLSHPKYKGCRFDITCRNSWGTHYADDYVSSDEENANSNNNVSTNSNNEKATASTPAKQEKSGTPKSSRVYSLVADSPQVTVAWVNMLDSLLTRSANSPRPDVDSPVENPRAKKSRAVARQRPSALDTESLVLLGPGELVPKAIIFAINFIFDSTPGIETEKFYEVEPDASKLKAALKFLNEFAGESVTRKPTKDELEELLDTITAGAVVRLWLSQLEQPLIPFTMYDDFVALAREAQSTPFDLRRNLRALLEALPKKDLIMLACLLFHLNDVNVYSSKNGMDAARLAHLFADFILRPQKKSPHAGNSNEDVAAVCRLVEEMITNVDTFIDEKEAQLLEDNRL